MSDNWDIILIRPFYNEFAWAYDELVDKPVYKICRFIENEIKENKFHVNAKIHDAGCGTGRRRC